MITLVIRLKIQFRSNIGRHKMNSLIGPSNMSVEKIREYESKFLTLFYF